MSGSSSSRDEKRPDKSRSSSPTKRTASEMDDDSHSDVNRIDDVSSTTNQHSDSMEIDVKSDQDQQNGSMDDLQPTSGTSPYIKQASSSAASSGTTPVSLQESSDAAATTAATTAETTAETTAATAATEADDSTSSTQVDASFDYDDGVPSIDDQVRTVRTEWANFDNTEGSPGYVVSSEWLARVLARSSFRDEMGPFEKSALEGEIGPVDNSSVMEKNSMQDSLKDDGGLPFVPLKQGLRMHDDFEILPPESWSQIKRWYGIVPGQQPIVRYLHDTSEEGSNSSHFQYEVYPPIFTIRKMPRDTRQADKDMEERRQLAPRLVSSRSQPYQSFLGKIKELANVPMQTKVKVYRVLETERTAESSSSSSSNTAVSTAAIASNIMSSMPSPPASRDVSPSGRPQPTLVIDSAAFKRLGDDDQLDPIELNDETSNAKYNGSINLHTLGLAADQVLILRETSTSKNENSAEGVKKSAATTGTTGTAGTAGTASASATAASKGLKGDNTPSEPSSGRATPSGVMTRGRNRAQGRAKGTVGLTNLGNTCYMNSALQCTRACEELTLYFLANTFKRELNSNNPLGHKGQIATTYGQLLHSLYDDNQFSFTPRHFKQVLGKYGPMFSGYGQQDSQEFMSFLVDGLHEDLNRILKKPYTENPESDDNTVNDPDAIRALGQKFRDNHRARNDSVVMDLFNGFYKNKLICPICSKVSITFDPFSLLTLQLPIENTWEHTFTWVPLNRKPVQIQVDMEKSSTVRNIKEFVATRIPNTHPDRMLLIESFSHKVYRTLEDRISLAEANIANRDDMILYELERAPTNFPAPKKKMRSMLDIDGQDGQGQDEVAADERMLVTVFHRAPAHSFHNSSKNPVLWPTFIVVTPEEAKDYDTIQRKVLERVAVQTTRDIFNEIVVERLASKTQFELHDQDQLESDVEITSEDDASSITDNVVLQARSVDSEDGLVDVTMVNGSDGDEGDEVDVEPNQADSLKESTDDLTAATRNMSDDLPAALKSIFEMHYLTGSSETIPTAWSSMDNGKQYPTIASRIPPPLLPPPPPPQKELSSSPEDTNAAASGESDEEDSVEKEPLDAQMSYDGEGSDGELSSLSFKPGSSRNQRKINGKKKNQKTFSKKANRNLSPKHSTFSQDTDDTVDGDANPALIRLYEAIILDWNHDAYEALFTGNDANEMRGKDSKRIAELLEDQELDNRRTKRADRKKKGVSLEDCFAETSKAEILTQENAWYCSRCKELRLASKQLEIWTLPDILVIHLKRFSASRVFRDKIDVLVDFPVEGLDLNDRVGMDDDKNLIYDLFAVDNHYGGLGGGHYTAFAKNFFDGNWYEYNDSSVSQRQASSVITPAAYLLFYRRRSAGPLGPPYLQKIVDRAYSDGNDAADSDDESSSRANSPSGLSKLGNGRRLGDPSPNGSPSASPAPAVALPPPHHLRGAGSEAPIGTDEPRELLLPGPGLLGTTTISSLVGDEDDDVLPSYEDEAIEMDDHSTSAHLPAWSFSGIDSEYTPLDYSTINSRNANEDDEDEDDGDSNVAAADADDVEEQLKMVTDFDDEFDDDVHDVGAFPAAHMPPSSPAAAIGDDDDIIADPHASPDESKLMQFAPEHMVGITKANHGTEDEENVAEVTVENEEVHLKNE